MKRPKLLLIGISLALLLVGCGGGSDDSDNNRSTPDKRTTSGTSNTSEDNLGTDDTTENPLIFDIKTIQNEKPEAVNLSVSTILNVAMPGVLSGIDQDNDKLTFEIKTIPSHGKISLKQATGAFTYSPEKGYVGTDEFVFRVSDGIAYSDDTKVSVTVSPQPPLNTADIIPPTAPTIVSLYTHDSESITLFWLAASDETTTLENLIYEVHLSQNENFTPSDQTKIISLKGAVETALTSLQPATTYFLKIVARDQGGNSSYSQEKSIATSTKTTVLSSASIKTTGDLNLHTMEVSEDKIVFTNIQKSRAPNKDQILVGNDENEFLKKVTAVEIVGDTLTVNTENVPMVTVFEAMELASQTTIFDIEKATLSEKAGYKKSRRYKPGVPTQTSITWPSRGFKVISDLPQEKNSKKGKPKHKSISNSAFNIWTVEDDNIAGQINETLEVEVNAAIHATQKNGFKLISLKLDSLTHPSKNHINNFGAYFTTAVAQTGQYTGSLKWYPKKSYTSKEPYTATFRAEAKDIDCGGWLDACDIVQETLSINIYIGEKPSLSSTTDISTSSSLELTNEVELTFEPTLTTKAVLEKFSVKEIELSIAGKLTLDAKSILKFANANKVTYTKSLFKKHFLNVYIAGGVPVFQETTFTLTGEFSANAYGAIDFTQTLNTSHNLKMGVQYINGKWGTIDEYGKTQDYTALINVEGKADVEIRLIPLVEVRFYMTATAGFSVEPWITGEVGAQAFAEFNTNFDTSDWQTDYRLTALNSKIGVDGKVYGDITIWEYNILRYPETGMKTVLTMGFPIFSLPKINLTAQGVPVKNMTTYEITADVQNGTNNPFALETARWKIFPSTGATITQNSNNPKKAQFSFTTNDVYKIYFLGAGQKITNLARQYEFITIDVLDSDGDGMNNTWEDEYGYNKNDPADKNRDDDNDGYTTIEEYLNGTNPRECDNCAPPEPPFCEGPNCQDDQGNGSSAATAMGDPHLRTFDGLSYDFQGVGEYVLVRSTQGDLEIQTRTQPWGNRRDVALNAAIAARVAGDRVGFYRAEVGLAVLLNGTLIELEEGNNNLPTGGTIYRSGNIYTLVWPDQSQMKVSRRSDFIEIVVSLDHSRQGTVSGLLGYFDGILQSELRTSDGQTFAANALGFTDLYDIFGESWRVDGTTTLFDYFNEETLEGFLDRNFPSSLLTRDGVRQRVGEIEYNRLVALCQQVVTLPARLDACVIDVGITGIEDGLDVYQRIAKPIEVADIQAPPLVTITAPQAGSIQSSNVTVRGTISADININSVVFSINGGSQTNLTTYLAGQDFVFSLPTSDLVEGNNQIVVYANDENGNTGNGVVFFVYDSSVAPEPGGDVIVVNDVNMFDNSHISGADNIQFVKNLVNFTGKTLRASGSKALWDSSHSSRCYNCVSTSTFRSTIENEGFIVDEVTEQGALTNIAPEVKLLILWTPTVAFNASEISMLKAFASEGGRILFVGENQGYYGQSGLDVENQFLQDMGALMRNVGVTTLGKTILQVGADNNHQTMTNVSGIQVNQVSLIKLGPSDYPLLTSADGAKVVAGVARINVNHQPKVSLFNVAKRKSYTRNPPSPIVYQNPGSSL